MRGAFAASVLLVCGNDFNSVWAAERTDPGLQVFRVVPSHMRPQPAFEEMAEPDGAATDTSASRLKPGTGPLALTPRNLDPGLPPPSSPAVRTVPTAFQTLPMAARAAPASAAASSGGKAVQIGAFRSRAEAEKALGNWRREAAALQRVAEPTIVAADLGEKGIYYRVRVGGFSDSRKAGEFCGEYKAPGRDCYVVP